MSAWLLCLSRRCLLLLVLAGIAVSLPARSGVTADPASADPAAARIAAFYATLLETMKLGEKAGIKARYEKLLPAIEETFDLPAITALVTGTSWSTIDQAQRNALVEGMRHMTVARYANNFARFNGQRFEVEPQSIPREGYRLVRSRIVRPDKEPVTLNYLMQRANGEWKILDVYYKGTISELATRRAEFSAVIRREGVDALARKLQEIGDRLMAGD